MPKRRAAPRNRSALLLFADSFHNADQLWFTGMHVPDPFIAMEIRGRRIGVFNALEVGRACKESTLDGVLSLEVWQDRVRKSLPGPGLPGTSDVILVLARHHKVRAFRVAEDFPVGLADELRDAGLKIEPAQSSLFPQREIKSEREIAALIAGNRCSALGIKAAEDMLKRAVIKGRRLLVDGRVLTSERLREEIEIACLRVGALSAHTIAAGGDQACDPHCAGVGPIRPGELVIVDVFPRVTATGYHGDMTRTFLKGAPSDAQRKLVVAVRKVQRRTIDRIKPRADGRKIHEQVCTDFDALGFETTRKAGAASGFIHGTGHGLGLAVHEAPSIGKAGTTLRKGAVVTIEPGLYYPGLGGCRIEDVVQGLPGKPKLLSKYHYRWVIS